MITTNNFFFTIFFLLFTCSCLVLDQLRTWIGGCMKFICCFLCVCIKNVYFVIFYCEWCWFKKKSPETTNFSHSHCVSFFFHSTKNVFFFKVQKWLNSLGLESFESSSKGVIGEGVLLMDYFFLLWNSLSKYFSFFFLSFYIDTRKKLTFYSIFNGLFGFYAKKLKIF